MEATRKWNKKMTKQDIIDILSERLSKYRHKTQRKHLMLIVDCTFNVFIDLLAKEGRIEVRNFGIFNVKKTPARVGRNPLTGEKAAIPARNIVQFKAGKSMKDRVASD